MISLVNISIFNALHGLAHTHALLDSVIIFCAQYVPIIIIIVGLLMYLPMHRHNKQGIVSFQSINTHIKEMFLVFGTAVMTWALVVLAKFLIHAPRPFIALGNAPLFPYGGFDSFPSGHAAFFAALAVALWFHHRRIALITAVCALVIGVARIVAGVHFPVDIAAGWVIGAGIAILVYKLFSHIQAKIKSKRT